MEQPAKPSVSEGTAAAGAYANVGRVDISYTDDVAGTRTDFATDPSSYFGADPAISIVKTTNGADGYVLADGVLASRANRPQLMVFDDAEQLLNNVSVVDFGYVELMPTPAEQVSRVFTVTNVGGVVMDVQLPIEVPLGFTLVETTDELDMLDGVLDEKVTLQPAGSLGSSFDFTIRVDAAAPGNAAGKVSFLSDDTNADPFEFGLAAQIGVQIVDNGDLGFQTNPQTTDFDLYQDPRHFQGDVHFHRAGSGLRYRGGLDHPADPQRVPADLPPVTARGSSAV